VSVYRHIITDSARSCKALIYSGCVPSDTPWGQFNSEQKAYFFVETKQRWAGSLCTRREIENEASTKIIGGWIMKQSGKSRGHNTPRKQSVRLPALVLKHSLLSRTKKGEKSAKTSKIAG